MAINFTANASANELGVYTLAGGCMSAVPDPAYPIDYALVRQIREEIDPSFRPLWVNNWWNSPNGGIVKTGCHVLARHVRHPRESAGLIAGLLFPTTSTYGITFENPILVATILDGLSGEERNKGALPRFVPITSETVATLKWAFWARNNWSEKEYNAYFNDADELAVDRAVAEVDSETGYARKNDSYQFKKHRGLADRVFVSSKEGPCDTST